MDLVKKRIPVKMVNHFHHRLAVYLN